MPKKPNIAALLRDSDPAEPGETKVEALHRVLKDENQARILLIPIDQIERNPDQPRKHFDPTALEELTASVREKGILQPIIVRKKAGSDRCIIIAGERWGRRSLTRKATRGVSEKDNDSDKVSKSVCVHGEESRGAEESGARARV